MNKIKYEDWFGNTENSVIIVITDSTQHSKLSKFFKSFKCESLNFLNVDDRKVVIDDLTHLDKSTLVIIALSIDSFIYKGYNRLFSPFQKPKELDCRYAFIRLDITEESLKEGLSTEKNHVTRELDKYLGIERNSMINVTAPGGTDLIFQINQFSTCNHFIDKDSDMAFLPPSELEAGIILGSANGVIVVDLTVGQINKNGEWLGQFGLVNNNLVKIIIEESKIIDIIGNDELKDILFALEDEARVLVELGKGLSKMTPTGIIGVDESIISTCHFGIGDGSCVNIDNAATIHLDVVVQDPSISVLLDTPNSNCIEYVRKEIR